MEMLNVLIFVSYMHRKNLSKSAFTQKKPGYITLNSLSVKIK